MTRPGSGVAPLPETYHGGMTTRRNDHERLRGLLEASPEVVTAYLFGSALTSRSPRDLDVAVVFSDETGDLAASLALQAHLESSLDRPVDLHELDRLPLDLRFRIVQRGLVLVDRDPVRRVRAEIAVFDAFNDFRPYLERIRTTARQRLVGGTDRG